jgi:hypothetical protein
MKVYAYIHPDLKTLSCALLPESVPEGIEAVEFDVNSIDDIVLDNGEIRLKTDIEKLTETKQKAVVDLLGKISGYILKYYPDTKQRSDVSDKENGESYLVYKGLDTNAVRKDITSLILSNSDFQSALDTLNKKYNASNDQMIAYWLSQVLKIAYRQFFVFQVKQEYATYLQQIQQATSLPLPDLEFKTPFPSLP